jgi:hypothetical protein
MARAAHLLTTGPQATPSAARCYARMSPTRSSDCVYVNAAAALSAHSMTSVCTSSTTLAMPAALAVA